MTSRHSRPRDRSPGPPAASGSPGRPTPPFSPGTPATATRTPSPNWSNATPLSSGGPAAGPAPTPTPPRTLSRPPSLPSPGRPGRSGGPSPCPAGCTGSPAGPPGGPGQPRRTAGPLPDRASAAPSPVEQASANELLAAVEQEVARLPEKYRSALLLCWFEDGSLAEAAQRLGVSPGVLWGRLKRGRERLRRRLAARGFGPAAVLAAAVLTGAPAAAGLVRRTVEAALRPPAGSPAAALGAWTWLKLAGAAAVAAAVVVGAATLFPTSEAAQGPAEDGPGRRWGGDRLTGSRSRRGPSAGSGTGSSGTQRRSRRPPSPRTASSSRPPAGWPSSSGT